MMLFKLSLKNIGKSFKDYAIYFLTLILGVAIFYVFNAMDSQQAMMEMNESKKQLLDLMNTMLGGVSVFVSFVLGFLIIYANKFLIKKRKKEFGIYMTLGMGKGHISKILLIETLLIGIISLVVGLIAGVFFSQLMSIIVAKMFEADMSSYAFTFSQTALIKTMVYFGIMYLLVMIFNALSISRYKLIDLLTANKKNERIKVKNPFVSVFVFVISIAVLGYAYYNVTSNMINLSFNMFITCIVLGIIGTILFFWSISGFILKLVQSNKKLYFKNLNVFVLRQINSKINTTVFSMSVICILLFLTITIFSTAMSLNRAARADLTELTPMDLEVMQYTDNDKVRVLDVLTKSGIKENDLKDIIEFNAYSSQLITSADVLGEKVMKENHKEVRYRATMSMPLLKLSDYNKIAEAFGNETVNLNSNEYLIVGDYKQSVKLHNLALSEGVKIKLGDKEYTPRYKKVTYGFIELSANHMTTGIVILPDSALTTADVTKNFLFANYNSDNDKEYEAIEKSFVEGTFSDNLAVFTKTLLYDSSIGVGAIVTFIGLYLGIIFLISSAAILALKELSESSDNKERYQVLRKIGADEKMINRSLFNQIGIFFLVPLLLAIVHSIFGIQCANTMLAAFGQESMLPAIIMTAVFVVIIYGGYFLVTYFSSKRIIKEK